MVMVDVYIVQIHNIAYCCHANRQYEVVAVPTVSAATAIAAVESSEPTMHFANDLGELKNFNSSISCKKKISFHDANVNDVDFVN